MQEALLVQRAMEGGPSGPGTGINEAQGTMGAVPGGFPAPGTPIPGNPIPGMEFLGGGQPTPRTFEQRFNSGITAGTPAQWNQPNSLAFDPPTNQFSGATGRPQGAGAPFGGAAGMGFGPVFIDPTTGQPAFPVNGEAIDRGGSNTRHDSSSSVSSGSGVPGLTGSEATPIGQSRQGFVPDSFSNPNREAHVSAIQEDAFGLYYIFNTHPDGSGARVNITKEGFCNRPQPNAQPICINMCSSDNQCPRNMKCCPNRCALECSEPLPIGQSGAGGGGQSQVSPSATDTGFHAVGGR